MKNVSMIQVLDEWTSEKKEDKKNNVCVTNDDYALTVQPNRNRNRNCVCV